MYKRVAGTKDILPEEALCWQELEQASRRVFLTYNYKEMRPPLLEEAALFNRTLGEGSEIVRKQMFLIQNKEETYALRPEGTASIVRAYVENNLDKSGLYAKFYYLGPMFRLERPQKGRLRQFHHIGCEAIGSQDPGVDIEVVSLAAQLLEEFSISGHTLKLNSLGCAEDRKSLSSLLQKGLKDQASKLCEDCQNRLKTNILRVLDCKNESCKEIVSKLELGNGYLCADCKAHFEAVKQGLDALGVEYALTPKLVRGLDYYTRTVFEISHPDLGSQDALGAGGRYDNLVKELGGPDVGAMGFAFGVERLLLAAKPQSHKDTSQKLSYLITLGEEAKKQGVKVLDGLRKKGIACDTDHEGKSLKAAMRKANDLGAKYVLLLGEDELKKNVITIKDMVSGEQIEAAIDDADAHLR